MDIKDIDSIKLRDIKQIETSSCSTNFSIGDVEFELWIITGGSPCLAFADYSFDERYPKVEMWSNEHFHSGNISHYDHQDIDHIQGPTITVLPNDLEDVKSFLRKYLPLRELRFKRIGGLPIKNFIKSNTVLDKENSTRVHCELDLRRISPVTFNSYAYCGRCSEKIILFSDWWKKTLSIFDPLFSSSKNWEDLTEEQYQEIVEHLKLFNPKKEGAKK